MNSNDTNTILDNWRVPFHQQRKSDADLYGRGVSSVCGDEIDVYLYVNDGVIQDAYFDGAACVISLGMASLVTRHVIGRSVEDAKKLTEADVFRLAPDVEIPKRRHGCALTVLKALQVALA
jgi:NifU-like protein involved in Fe-S cluster formation